MGEDQSVNVTGSGNRVVAHSRLGSREIDSDAIVANEINSVHASEISRLTDVILAGVEREQGMVSIGYEEGRGWAVGLVFGREAEDSDMAGGASYGIGTTLEQALRMVVEETGWDRR